ncbi:MAG: NAD-dependent epimerase/dehydratase family protein [Hamadaea sp.]|uniref:SDR family oxidoreductase n=1 Tax=Hamadaea sp. TaxID=2024425 RepID=UPI00181DE78E|nr:SDR family oxidoreductase [Hamadaea sp.]NUT22762.1 NAD-dependent epimerase/dehydratase family protein [Hamadaea sp.]
MTTLITGADGYLGRRIATALLGSDDLVLGVRAADNAELNRKRAALAHLSHLGHQVVPVDLRDDDPFAYVDPGRITRIVHAAALIRFDLERADAEQVNVTGTARVREFAERCDRLDRLMFLSTLYAAGRRRGDIRESRLGDVGFVNHYEWSKWAAEELLLDSDLPVTILRLPTVIAEDATGAIGQFNVFHHTLRLFHRGLLTLVPGDPATPLSLATAEFTADAAVAMLAANPGIYHACAGPVALGEVIETAFTVFEADPDFQRRMLPRPVSCDRAAFLDLADAASRLRGGALQPVLPSLLPFAEQLYLPKTFRADRLRAAWPGYREHDSLAVVAAAARALVVALADRRADSDAAVSRGASSERAASGSQTAEKGRAHAAAR